MSLPQRDGVNDRYYLIHKPDTSPEVLAEADLCIQDILNGTARENHAGFPSVVRNHKGTPFLPSQLLERYLSNLPLKGFPYEEAVAFCDSLRRLAAGKRLITHWSTISKSRCRRGILRLERKRTTFRLIHPVLCGRSCGRKRQMTACCTLPVMWPSAIRCMGPATTPSPPNISWG